MYQNEYEKAVEQVKTAAEFTKDCRNISRCEANIHCFNREQALICLQDMIQEYKSQINTFGLWIDGVHVIYGVYWEQFDDKYIQDQLQYILRHIPVYVLLREGETELAKRICLWLDQKNNK